MLYRSVGRRVSWQIGDRPGASVRAGCRRTLSSPRRSATGIARIPESIARQIARIVDPSGPSRQCADLSSEERTWITVKAAAFRADLRRVDFITSRARRASGTPRAATGVDPRTATSPDSADTLPHAAESRTERPAGTFCNLSLDALLPLLFICRSELYLEPRERDRRVSNSERFEDGRLLTVSSYILLARQPISRTHIFHDHRRLSVRALATSITIVATAAKAAKAASAAVAVAVLGANDTRVPWTKRLRPLRLTPDVTELVSLAYELSRAAPLHSLFANCNTGRACATQRGLSEVQGSSRRGAVAPVEKLLTNF